MVRWNSNPPACSTPIEAVGKARSFRDSPRRFLPRLKRPLHVHGLDR